MRRIAPFITTLVIAALVAVPAEAGLGPSGTITSITPSSGPVAGGTTVTILGTDLRYGISGPAVEIGGRAAPRVSWRSYGAFGETEVIVTTPEGTAGPADVRVISDTYANMQFAVRASGFTYVAPAPPTPAIAVTKISPAKGLTTGGEQVTITGSGFSGGATPTVTFTDAAGKSAAATDVTVGSDGTTLTASTPALAKGVAGISVSRDGVSATLASAYTYEQGYWLTVTTRQPKDIGKLTSPGAIRSTNSTGAWLGKWATESTQKFVERDTDYTVVTSGGYAGGLNCGARSTYTERNSIFLEKPLVYSTTWSGGPCRYALAASTTVGLQALPSSDQVSTEVYTFSGGCTPWACGSIRASSAPGQEPAPAPRPTGTASSP